MVLTPPLEFMFSIRSLFASACSFSNLWMSASLGDGLFASHGASRPLLQVSTLWMLASSAPVLQIFASVCDNFSCCWLLVSSSGLLLWAPGRYKSLMLS